MAADAYISTAVSHLHDAVSELHDEIRQIQMDAYDHEQRLNGEVSQAHYDEATARADLTARDIYGDDNRKHELQVRINQLHLVINQKKQEADKRSNDAAAVVRQKTELMNKLQSLASQLEPLISQARG